MSDDLITEGSGKVFADIGLPNADELLVKADIALCIQDRIDELGLTQAEAARRLRITQPRVSNLLRGRLERFSVDMLLRLIMRLDVDVEIRFVPRRQESGQVRMVDPAA